VTNNCPSPLAFCVGTFRNVGSLGTSYSFQYGFNANAAFGFTNGVLGFNVIGPSGSNVVIQASSDLHTWVPLQTNLLGSGPLHFSDTQSPTNRRRFYRAQLSP